jgi:hypothetical protein
MRFPRFFRKGHDPIAARERELTARIAALQDQIQELRQQLETDQAQPRLRSTALPPAKGSPASPAQAEPAAFEKVDRPDAAKSTEAELTRDHYNELGVRKYDVVSVVRRWLSRLRGAAPANPKLVNYLVSGSIHGLRPLRYERRVARNRCLVVIIVVVAIVWGTIWFFVRRS